MVTNSCKSVTSRKLQNGNKKFVQSDEKIFLDTGLGLWYNGAEPPFLIPTNLVGLYYAKVLNRKSRKHTELLYHISPQFVKRKVAQKATNYFTRFCAKILVDKSPGRVYTGLVSWG
jgi:hypothetical protein